MIQKGGLCPLRLIPLMSSLFMPFQGIAPENSWPGGMGGRFFEGLQNYMQNRNEGNENKILLWGLKLYYG